MSRLVAAFFVVGIVPVLLGAGGAAPAPATVRIMPLGDSITEGNGVPGGYRVDLEDRLAADGVAFDFVGTQANGPDTLADKEHEGHPAWRIEQVAAHVDDWVAAERPDVVLVTIGTNDMVQDFKVEAAPRRLGVLLDRIHAASPQTEVLVSSIPPIAHPTSGPRARRFNAEIPRLVRARALRGHPVRYVDIAKELAPADLAEGVHPNAVGYSKMATSWHAALRRRVEPTPVRGAPLPPRTGLRLLVADNPPFVLDVDSGRVTPLAGAPTQPVGPVSVVGVAGRSAVVVAGPVRAASVYAVRGRDARVSSLGTGTAVAAAADGRAVWIESANGPGCALHRADLDGRVHGRPRSVRCAGTIASGGSRGLVVNRTRLLDPATGRTLLRTRWGVLAAAGRTLVLAGPGDRLTLLDVPTGRERRFRRPSVVRGRDHPAIDPNGRYVALAFATPAWEGGGRQVLDVWVLDTRKSTITQLAGMPAFVALKATSMAWSHDGRLVILGESGGRDVVAVARPGQRRLQVKTVELPERRGGSDTFAVLAD